MKYFLMLPEPVRFILGFGAFILLLGLAGGIETGYL